MNVLFVASECAPFVKTGGLADVIGAVPKALSGLGISVRVLLPGYPALKAQIEAGEVVKHYPDLYGGAANIVAVSSEGLDLLLLDAPHLFDRPGEIYLDATGHDWDDNYLRFGGLSWVGARIALEGINSWKPDVVNAHDWQAALLPAFLHGQAEQSPPIVLTVHNIAFQGLFNHSVIAELGVDEELFHPNGIEYFGKVGFLKAGLSLATKITTVSPTYANELLSPEFGMGLDGLLSARREDLTGILNGVDVNVWNPETDPELSEPYSKRTYKRKAKNRLQVEARFNLNANADAPLFCMVSRLTRQKGVDLLLACLPALVEQGARLAVLGSGEASIEQTLLEAANRYPGSVGVILGYDEQLSHILQGGSDAILIPSRFEPCGLTQLYGLRYGTLPVVSRTGGLADTVIDANEAALTASCATGFQFSPIDATNLAHAIERVCSLFKETSAWSAMMRRAMAHPVGWDHSAAAYHHLYSELVTS